MHVLVIAIHTLAFRSFFIREHSALHEAILQSPVSSAINCAGAASVDGFFLLSGLLLVRAMARLRDEADVAGFLVEFAPRRFLRLSLLIACYVGVVAALGVETCTLGQGLDVVLLLVQFKVFTPHWKSLWTYLWSASADFWQQCALAAVLAVGVTLWGPLLLNRRLATATLALVAAASVVYRACVFDPASASYWLLVKHAHIVSVIGNDEALGLASKYGVRLTASGPGGLAVNGTTDDFHRTFAALYAAPLARIAPMALGGIAGLWADSADAHVPYPRLVHGLCAAVLALGAVPVDRAVFATSWGVQFFATVLGHVRSPWAARASRLKRARLGRRYGSARRWPSSCCPRSTRRPTSSRRGWPARCRGPASARWPKPRTRRTSFTRSCCTT